MRKVFALLVTLLELVVVVQFFLAAKGAFDSAPREEAFALHRTLGYTIVLLAVLLALAAAFLRMPGRIVGLTGVVAGLTVLQPVIRAVAVAVGQDGTTTTTVGELLFGVHAVNAMVIMVMLASVERLAREGSDRAPDATAAPPPVHQAP